MKKLLLALLLIAASGFAQQFHRYSATSGDVSLVSAGTTVTIQQLANGVPITIESIQIYCSVACSVTQAVNGTAATATAGTILPLAPTGTNYQAPFTFWTASNVGSGTQQGGITHVPAASTTLLCLSRACGITDDIIIPTGGTAANYSVTVGSITGTVNITYIVRIPWP